VFFFRILNNILIISNKILKEYAKHKKQKEKIDILMILSLQRILRK